MFDTRRLLEGFLGGGASRGTMTGGGSPFGGLGGGSLQDALGRFLGGGAGGASGGLGGMAGGLGGLLGGMRPPMGGAIGSAAAGGLLGSLLGGRRSGGGGSLLRVGGLAVLGMLAHRAYTQWQEGQAASTPGAPSPGAPQPIAGSAWSNPSGYSRPGTRPAPAEEEFAQDDAPDEAGRPFALSLIRAMVAAAKADGHLDQGERKRIFAEVERMGLDANSKSFVFQAIEGPADPALVADGTWTDVQKTKLYLASRLVAEPDTSAERAYLDALAHRLGLDPGLRATLDDQAAEATRVAVQGGATTST